MKEQAEEEFASAGWHNTEMRPFSKREAGNLDCYIKSFTFFCLALIEIQTSNPL